MAEVKNDTPKEFPDPSHVKRSLFALQFLNDEIKRLIVLRNNVAFLKKYQLSAPHHEFNAIQEMLRGNVQRHTQGKVDELKQCEVSVKSAKEVYEEILKEEKVGRWL